MTDYTPHRSLPMWVWAFIIVLAAIEPATHAWIAWFPPSGTVPTGLHTGDSHVYLNAMRMFQTDFYSPYASCQSPSHGFGYYAMPTHVFYGLLGLAADATGLGHFMALGLFNGLFAAFYLFAAYGFLRTAAPRQANLAFALFALGGGIGGILYIATGVFGLHIAPSFEAVFLRYAEYDLVEGSYLWPASHFPRLYYTAPLGCALLALSGLIRIARGGKKSTFAWACLLLLIAQIINMRVGVFAWGVGLLFLFAGMEAAFRRRATLGALFTLPILAGGAVTMLLMRLHPTFSMNVVANAREAVWFSAFISAALPQLLLIPGPIRRHVARLPYAIRIAASALLGYLAVFCVLYLGYQAYYGNLWRISDTMAAVFASDYALTGALAGGIWGLLWRRRSSESESLETAWISLWFLAFFAVSISAWGQGWFMQFLPRRLLVLMALPICILSAQALQHIGTKRLRLARGLAAAVLCGGACSVAVGALCFQGPLGLTPGQGPFANRHYELMTQTDAGLLNALGPGRVLAPVYNPYAFTEVLALRPSNSVVFGVGTLNHSDLAFQPMKDQVDRFFSIQATDAERRAFALQWQADYVYCPDTCPVDAAVMEQLHRASWLRLVADAGRGALFAVVKP